MIPASLRHPSVVVCALTCVLATGVLTAHTFFPQGARIACPWVGESRQPSDNAVAPLPLPAMEMLDTDGKPLTTESLKGRVWLCDFFLTRCTGICPALNQRFSQLSKELDADMKYAGVGLLSVAVDPAFDTPEVLREHRAHLAAGPRWLHATWKDQDTAWKTIRAAFLLEVGPADPADKTTPVMHSDKIVLVDAKGRIRGYYGGREENEIKLLRHDLDLLLAEKP